MDTFLEQHLDGIDCFCTIFDQVTLHSMKFGQELIFNFGYLPDQMLHIVSIDKTKFL